MWTVIIYITFFFFIKGNLGKYVNCTFNIGVHNGFLHPSKLLPYKIQTYYINLQTIHLYTTYTLTMQYKYYTITVNRTIPKHITKNNYILFVLLLLL